MNAKHTEGPWEYSRMLITAKTKDRRSGFVVNGPDTDPDTLPPRICDLRAPRGMGGFAVGEANARLIAAAPELLAALQCAPEPPSDFDTEDGCRAYAECVMAWLDSQCAAAIAKATTQPVTA